MTRVRLLTVYFFSAALLAPLTGASARRDAAPTLAAPEIVIFYGPMLPERRVIADWHENHKLLLTDGRRLRADSSFARRPVVELALFWGAQWRPTAESPERLRALRPEPATQHGKLYPATASSPTVLAVGQRFDVVSNSGLAVLRRYGVPVRISRR